MLKATLATIEEALGGVDVLINNAASDDRHSIAEVTPDYWDERMAVNLRHQFFAAQAVVPAMKRAGGGVILNFGSISWHLALADLVLYQTAKAAIEGLTRSLARDLGRFDIRVNTIVPGNVKTPRQMMWYTPEGEAEIVAAQCLDAAHHAGRRRRAGAVPRIRRRADVHEPRLFRRRRLALMASGRPELACRVGAMLGEGPVWVTREQALWFVDIKGHQVHRFDPAAPR